MIQFMASDVFLRMVSFYLAIFALSLLLYVEIFRISLLTRGEIIVREGLGALLIAIIYGTGEQLWHWPHWRLYILSLALAFVVIGLVWMTCEKLVDRRTVRTALRGVPNEQPRVIQ
jgi:branched-subunit amino acid ABC-type transport system permease component